jgi:predicted Fe-S protein YdhL (DUF1289 family)
MERYNEARRRGCIKRISEKFNWSILPESIWDGIVKEIKQEVQSEGNSDSSNLLMFLRN